MFSKDLKRLPFDNIIPYNENDLLLIANPYLAFRLTNIVDDNNSYFSIKSVMTEHTDPFACADFNRTCTDFAEIMEARIERYFVTKKVTYLFFDEEEQNFLKTMFRNNTLTSSVILYMRTNVRETFKEIDYTDLVRKEYLEVSKYLRRLRIMTVVRPDQYYSMYVSSKKESKERFENLRRNKDKEFMKKMFDRYPKLKDIKTKSQFRTYYLGLSKKYHPDASQGSHEMFAEISVNFELLKETYWYRSLTDDAEDTTQQQQARPKEFNILLQSKEEKR
jgi:hypothetical protein